MKLALGEIDRLSPDDPTLPNDGHPSPRFYRHLYFAHFGLGEPWGESFKIAYAFRNAPLSVEAMRHISEGWNDEAEVSP